MVNNGPPPDVPAGTTGPVLPPPVGGPSAQRPLPGPPLDVPAILDWSWRTYLRRAGPLLALTALLVAPVALASGTLGGNPAGGTPGFSLGILLLPPGNHPLAFSVGVLDVLVLQPIYLVAVYRLISGIYLGDPTGVGSVLRQGVRRFPGMLWVNVWLAIAFLAVGAIGLALVLLLTGLSRLVPEGASTAVGIVAVVLFFVVLLFFFTRLQLSNAAYVVENARGRMAVGRSWLLTEGRFWRCLGLFVSAAFLGGVVNFALATSVRRLTGIGFADGNALTGAAVALGQLFTAPFLALVTTAVLFAARAESEPLDHASALATLKANDR